MLGKKELSETLGLSCVEKYFAAWLRKFTDVAKLYGASFVSMAQVLDDFAHGATYQNYCYLPRLQDIAEEYGIVSHEYVPCSAKRAEEILRELSPDALGLIRVNTSFFTEFKRSSWREDHYVCVNGDLKWINEYPLSEGVFTAERFAQVYDGAVCVYKTARLDNCPDDLATQAILKQDFSDSAFPLSLDKAEEAAGVLRMTRKRLEKFYEAKENVREVLSKENALLDRIYFNIRLRLIREERGEKADSAAHGEIRKSMKAVAEFEKKLREELGK